MTVLIGGSSPSTPVNNYHMSSAISPTIQHATLTPTQSGHGNHQRLAHGHFPPNPESPLVSSSQLIHPNTPSLFGGVDHLTGPVTPLAPTMANYNKGVVNTGAGPLTPVVEGGSLHPLQHSTVQYSQVNQMKKIYDFCFTSCFNRFTLALLGPRPSTCFPRIQQRLQPHSLPPISPFINSMYMLRPSKLQHSGSNLQCPSWDDG